MLGAEVENKKATTDDLTEKLNAILTDPEYLSPYDDLAFDMYVDTEVAKIIREMEIKKHTAVISTKITFLSL